MNMSSLLSDFENLEKELFHVQAKTLLGSLVQSDSQYVGEVVQQSYDTALIQIHDHYRKQVGGIPSLSFLVATRLTPNADFDFTVEDSSVILLRVMDSAPLPNDVEALRVRVETAQQVTGVIETNW